MSGLENIMGKVYGMKAVMAPEDFVDCHVQLK
jgi:hypothetical protein